jgi:outer membrane protein with beta-barrel domain
MRRAFLVFCLLFLLPAAASAQVTVRGFADAGFMTFSATDSFKAILGKSSGPLYGGGIEFGDRQFFLSLGARRFSHEGHRVFVFENQVFTLNVNDKVTVTPVDLTFGYRFRSHGLVPFAGGGVSWSRFTEISDHATDDENVKHTYRGGHIMGGAEVPLQRWLAAAVDAQWSAVPDDFDAAATSVAKLYDEHDLGGFTVRARIVFGR